MIAKDTGEWVVSPHALAGSEGVLEVYSALEKKKKEEKKTLGPRDPRGPDTASS